MDATGSAGPLSVNALSGARGPVGPVARLHDGEPGGLSSLLLTDPMRKKVRRLRERIKRRLLGRAVERDTAR
jgi:hypothetical protein